MKRFTLISLLVASTLASSCHPNYPCCNGRNVIYTDQEGDWGVENNQWCFIAPEQTGTCSYNGYPCCKECNTIYTDNEGAWGVENNDWCKIVQDNCGRPNTTVRTTTRTTTTTSRTTVQTGPTVDHMSSFFNNQLYYNPDFQKKVQSSIDRLSGDLRQKAMKVKDQSTAIWLSWDGAPTYVSGQLDDAGSRTISFIQYYIPIRDCNSLASAGGANEMDGYKRYVDSVYNSFASHPNSKIIVVIEPDTVGNLVTSQSNEKCKLAHSIHKQAIAYAISKYGSLSNVQAYLDIAHGGWIGDTGNVDKAAAIIKEILGMVTGNAKIRGFSSNVSNFRPVAEEYPYYEKMNEALAKIGITGMRYAMDTSRGAKLVVSPYNTWCNLKGTGIGERPRINPDPENMPLLDGYMWFKIPGEADGSSVGSHADPVCANSDSLQVAPDAGGWFHELFVQLITNANPTL